MLHCPQWYTRIPTGQTTGQLEHELGSPDEGLWVPHTSWWFASSNCLVGRPWSRVLIDISVPLSQYFHIGIPKQTKPRSSDELVLERQTDIAKHNPTFTLQLRLRFPAPTWKGGVLPFFSQIKRHSSIFSVILKLFLEFPDKVKRHLICLTLHEEQW